MKFGILHPIILPPLGARLTKQGICDKMALLGRTELGIEDKSHSVSVGNNPRSHLMYYLNCVSSLLGLEDDGEIRRLSQFDRHDLSDDETDSLLAYCYLLSPDVLLGK